MTFPNQYKRDFFTKLGCKFVAGRSLLDVGCGDGSDALIFTKNYHLRVSGFDVYRDSHLPKSSILKFKPGSIYKIPFADSSFDYVFIHDVLHHIDEPLQRWSKHRSGLKELSRVCKPGGQIIIAEGNRYNPLFYPHMVKKLHHEHFSQSYFKKLHQSVFPHVKFRFFEAHLYPPSFLKLFKVYEWFMEHLSPQMFLSYNVAIITNVKKRSNSASA